MPDLEQARSFARRIREKHPGKCVFFRTPFSLILQRFTHLDFARVP